MAATSERNVWGIWMVSPAPSPVFFSDPVAPRCSRLTRTVSASRTMAWEGRPRCRRRSRSRTRRARRPGRRDPALPDRQSAPSWIPFLDFGGRRRSGPAETPTGVPAPCAGALYPFAETRVSPRGVSESRLRRLRFGTIRQPRHGSRLPRTPARTSGSGPSDPIREVWLKPGRAVTHTQPLGPRRRSGPTAPPRRGLDRARLPEPARAPTASRVPVGRGARTGSQASCQEVQIVAPVAPRSSAAGQS